VSEISFARVFLGKERKILIPPLFTKVYTRVRAEVLPGSLDQGASTAGIYMNRGKYV